jgi:hypothetical protein
MSDFISCKQNSCITFNHFLQNIQQEVVKNRPYKYTASVVCIMTWIDLHVLYHDKSVACL